VGTELPATTRKELVNLICSYKEIFAWKPSDMTGVSRDVVPGSKAIQQKKQGQAGDRNHTINTEVAKLLEARILKEAIFPTWIANPVMVKKSNGSWRMCIDFTDLNKACPKD